jgi:NADPH:quinone reductase-like Zn-dependent oxidoreductase
MSFAEGAAIPVNYLTAYHILFEISQLRPKSRVLVHMAAGGVGLAAIQLLQLIPEVVIFGTSSAGKHDLLREKGVQHPIDYRNLDYAEEVRRITDGEGVDLVMDALGGADWKTGYELLRPAGQLVAFGFANAVQGKRRNLFKVVRQWFRIPRFNPLKLMDHNRGVAGVNLGRLWDQRELLNREMTAILEHYEAGVVRPHIDSTFPLEEAAKAHHYIQDRKNIGKVVLVTEDAETN